MVETSPKLQPGTIYIVLFSKGCVQIHEWNRHTQNLTTFQHQQQQQHQQPKNISPLLIIFRLDSCSHKNIIQEQQTTTVALHTYTHKHAHKHLHTQTI